VNTSSVALILSTKSNDLMAVGWVFASPTGVDLRLKVYLLSARRMEIVSMLKMHAHFSSTNKETMVTGARVIRSVFIH